MHSPTNHPAGPWVPDLGDGTYRNPVIHADYSDPDVIRVDDEFFLTASSFNCTPGLPLLRSRDLVNWTLIGHALQNVPDARYAEVQPGCGVWAPAMRHHAGKFWIFFPTPDEGIYATTAMNPGGPWTEPWLVQAGRGLIDPCPLWDDDGQAYLVHAYAGSRAGIKHRLVVRPMAPDGSRLLGEGRVVFHEPDRHPTLEGPKFLKRDGWYYISAPAGGVKEGWQVILRSRNVYGPYEDKIVLSQGKTKINGPHQGALVDTPSGQWWFVHFQDAEVYGRITHLQPVEWVDGWPMLGQGGEPVERFRLPVSRNGTGEIPQTTDEFDQPNLGWQWQWNANHCREWYSLTARPGHLRLYSQTVPGSDLQRAANLLLQKFPAPEFTVETALEFCPEQEREECGLVVAGRDSASLSVRCTVAGRQLWWRRPGQELLVSELGNNVIKLRLQVARGGRCQFGYDLGKGWENVLERFQACAGVWIGARAGLYSLRPNDRGGWRIYRLRLLSFQWLVPEILADGEDGAIETWLAGETPFGFSHKFQTLIQEP